MRVTVKSGVWGLVGFLAFAIALVAVAHHPAVRGWFTAEAISRWVESFGLWGPLGILAISLVLPFVFLPRWPVVFVAGALSGIAWGTVIGICAGTLGAALHFALSRKLFHPVGDRVRRRFKLPERLSDKQAFLLIFTLRAFPLANYGLTNLMAGALGMRLGPFLLSTFFGMIPSTLMYATWGKLVKKPSPAYYALAIGLVILLMAGSWLAGRRILVPPAERSEDDELDPAGG
jgi:uncharacterized membrane protein YdjX (TVP38/TMEM64 family)